MKGSPEFGIPSMANLILDIEILAIGDEVLLHKQSEHQNTQTKKTRTLC
jgi:hypothetical protein